MKCSSAYTYISLLPFRLRLFLKNFFSETAKRCGVPRPFDSDTLKDGFFSLLFSSLPKCPITVMVLVSVIASHGWVSSSPQPKHLWPSPSLKHLPVSPFQSIVFKDSQTKGGEIWGWGEERENLSPSVTRSPHQIKKYKSCFLSPSVVTAANSVRRESKGEGEAEGARLGRQGPPVHLLQASYESTQGQKTPHTFQLRDHIFLIK